jgi:hypothetical protein
MFDGNRMAVLVMDVQQGIVGRFAGDADGAEQGQRDNGGYGPPTAVAERSSRQDRVLVGLGRDPRWTPPELEQLETRRNDS